MLYLEILLLLFARTVATETVSIGVLPALCPGKDVKMLFTLVMSDYHLLLCEARPDLSLLKKSLWS